MSPGYQHFQTQSPSFLQKTIISVNALTCFRTGTGPSANASSESISGTHYPPSRRSGDFQAAAYNPGVETTPFNLYTLPSCRRISSSCLYIYKTTPFNLIIPQRVAESLLPSSTSIKQHLLISICPACRRISSSVLYIYN